MQYNHTQNDLIMENKSEIELNHKILKEYKYMNATNKINEEIITMSFFDEKAIISYKS